MNRRRIALVVAVILVLLLGTYITQSFAQDGSGLPNIPDVPEYVFGQKSVPILPKVPVIVDGVRVDPDTFAEHYSMADLRFFLDPETPDIMYAFSTDEGLQEFLKKFEKRGKSNEVPEDSRASSNLYDGYNFTGSYYAVPACQLRWTLVGFNDKASSVYATTACDYFAIYEHIYGFGRYLSTSGGSYWSNLSYYGFDNITSSAEHWP